MSDVILQNLAESGILKLDFHLQTSIACINRRLQSHTMFSLN